MPQVPLSETSTFTSTISVPQPGDKRKIASLLPAIQGLTNRSRDHKDRLDELEDRLDGFCIGSGNLSSLGLAEDEALGAGLDPSSSPGFVDEGDAIRVPAAGPYLLMIDILLRNDDTANPKEQGLVVKVNGVQVVERSIYRFSSDPDHSVRLSFNRLITIADAGHLVTFHASEDGTQRNSQGTWVLMKVNGA
jgi:hypothetical protein